MSGDGFTPGDSTPSPGDTQAALEALGEFAPLLAGAAVVLGLADVPPTAEPPPADPLALLHRLATSYRHNLYDHLVKNGTPGWWASVLSYIADAAVFGFGLIPAVVLYTFEAVGPSVVSIGLKMIDQFRKKIDVQVAGVAVLVLNELLGTTLTADRLATGEDVQAHIERAGQVGHLFLDAITHELAEGQDLEQVDGREGAAHFAGLIVNFGVATAMLGLAGEVGTAGFIKNFRLIGEQVSSGLGLSKQMRIAIKPLMKTLVATPFQWQLNRKFHPQRFSAAEVVNPFAQTVMDHDVIVKDLELQGWSPDRSEQLIKLHQKRLSVDEVELLRRWGGMDDAFAAKYVADLGWPAEFVPMLLSLPELKRKDARILKLIDALEENVVLGHMTVDEFMAFINTLPLTDGERAIIQATVTAKVRAPHKSLTLAEMQTAFEDGLINLDDLHALLEKRGYTGDEEL